MKIKASILKGIALIGLLLSFSVAPAQELKPIELPTPQMDGGRPLMQVLNERHTTRTFSPEKLPMQVISNLLWAAFGINRPAIGGRTAPSAVNWQEIDIYVAMADGLFLYDAKKQLLVPLLKDDVRAMTGTQAFVKDAPVNLIYVADLARTKRASSEDTTLYTAADTGFISQNVYLFCTSEKLATVVRGSVDRAALAKTMKLRPEQRIILAQSVGKPK
ncbi:MAG: nitroreductase family protein [Terriglobia bacterium]